MITQPPVPAAAPMPDRTSARRRTRLCTGIAATTLAICLGGCAELESDSDPDPVPPTPCADGSIDPAGVGCDGATTPAERVANFRFEVDPASTEPGSEDFVDLVEARIGGGFESFNRIDNFFGGATVPVTYRTCDRIAAFYTPARRDITLCDELTETLFFAFLPDEAPATEAARDEATGRALAGAFSAMTFVGFHEAGHALEDMRSIGTAGNFESVADQIGTVLSVQVGDPYAPLHAARFFLEATSSSGSASPHGNGVDRAWNLVCWATGSSSRVAAQLPDMAMELVRNNRDCTAEYADGLAYVQRLVPGLREVPPATALRSAQRDGRSSLARLEAELLDALRAHPTR